MDSAIRSEARVLKVPIDYVAPPQIRSAQKSLATRLNLSPLDSLGTSHEAQNFRFETMRFGASWHPPTRM